MKTDNGIGDTGATSLSDGLKTNTTLTELCLWGKTQNNQSFFFNKKIIHFHPNNNLDNEIRNHGAKALSNALKINTTITDLDLESKDFIIVTSTKTLLFYQKKHPRQRNKHHVQNGDFS